MAGQVARHEPMSADKPFIFRVALPWLVGTLFPHDLLDGFRTLNVATGVLTLGVLSLFLTRFATGTAVAIVLFLFVANPNGPLRFSHFYPGLTDAPALLCILLIFFVHQQWPRSSLGKIATVSVLTLVGVTFREITVTAPVALWGGAALAAGIRGDGVWPRLRALLSPWLVPIAAGVAGIVITHVSVTANGDYAFITKSLASVRHNQSHPLMLPLALFTAYGPCLILLGPYWPAVWAKLTEHREFSVYLMLITALALVGGTHTDRFVYWSFPVVLPLLSVAIGSLIGERRSVYLVALIGSIVVSQILAFRIFGAFPNGDFDAVTSSGHPSLWLFGPYGDNANFAQMYAAYMDGSSRLILLSEYVGLIGWILTLHWLNRRSPHDAETDRRAVAGEY
jgi:hypothetical protein